MEKKEEGQNITLFIYERFPKNSNDSLRFNCLFNCFRNIEKDWKKQQFTTLNGV